MKRVLAAAVGALLLAGCAGVPSSSSPETIQPLDTGAASTGAPRANLSGGPRNIVTRFLEANATTTGTHPTARQYLTPAANSRWDDSTATIIGNDSYVGTYNPRKNTVVVYGSVLGTLDADGIYTPSLVGTGAGGDRQPFVFGLAKLHGQYRIDRLRPGLLLTDQQFRDSYRQQQLYFYNLAEDSLVPDLRWSALDDRHDLAEWLLGQLVIGPRPELANAVSLDTLPAHIDANQINVQLGSPTLIEIPGSSQLDSGVRERLAAQVSQTLLDALAGRDMTITDGGKPVLIPSVGGDSFNAADFAAAIGPPTPASEVYYLSGGRIRDENGKPVPDLPGSAPLRSFAVSRATPDGPLLVAGVTGSASNGRLEVSGGVRGERLRPTSVQGALTRPAFVPGRNEVWIGDGSRIYRVTVGSGAPRATPVPIPAVSGGGQVVALRLSPEGYRVAIVVAGAGGAKQLYVGSIVRGAGPVRVDKLDPISPTGVVVTDVAWLDPFKLFAIGYLAVSQESRTFETGVDGTDWASEPSNLPAPPDSVTAATSSTVWVSANGFVWKQSGTTWVSPGPTGQTHGTAPAYLE